MKIDFSIQGADQLDRMLQELPRAVSKRIARNSIRAGARVVVAEAKDLVEKKTGKLRRAIKVRAVKQKQSNLVEVTAGVKGPEGGLAHLVEFGTAQHRITPKKKGGVLAFQSGGETRFAAEVLHPGAKPKPFLRPAADNKAVEVVAKVAETIGTGIEREAAKLAPVVGRTD